MRLIKFSIAIMVGVLATAYSSGADFVVPPLENEHKTTNALTAGAVTSFTINGKTPEELFASGDLLKLVRKVPMSIPATRDDTGEALEIPATTDELLGYVLRILSTQNPRQTVTLDYRQTEPGVFEVTFGEADYEDRFYPKDPREILIEMYSKKTNAVSLIDTCDETFTAPFSIGQNLLASQAVETMASPAGIYVYEGKIMVSAQNFAVQHGSLIASPLPIEFQTVNNPFIRAVSINSRPFYKEVGGIPACFNATLLEMTGNNEELKIKASFVGALHKPAIEVLFSPAIMPGAAAAAV